MLPLTSVRNTTAFFVLEVSTVTLEGAKSSHKTTPKAVLRKTQKRATSRHARIRLSLHNDQVNNPSINNPTPIAKPMPIEPSRERWLTC